MIISMSKILFSVDYNLEHITGLFDRLNKRDKIYFDLMKLDPISKSYFYFNLTKEEATYMTLKYDIKLTPEYDQKKTKLRALDSKSPNRIQK